MFMDTNQNLPPVEEGTEKAAARAVHKKSKLYRPAVALLGLVVIVLAVVGVISLAVTGINNHQKDQQKLKEDLTYFISPLAYYTPVAFEDVNKTAQDALILSAIYRITESERIRQLQEDDLEYSYETDDYGRLALPVADVAEAYAALYGKEAKPFYHTVGETDNPYSCYEYNAAKELYYVPADSSESLYDVFVDTVKQQGDTYTLDVCYVPDSNLTIDDRGNTVPPTRESAQYIQQYILKRSNDQWQIVAVKDLEDSVSTTASTTETETTASKVTATTTKKKK